METILKNLSKTEIQALKRIIKITKDYPITLPELSMFCVFLGEFAKQGTLPILDNKSSS